MEKNKCIHKQESDLLNSNNLKLRIPNDNIITKEKLDSQYVNLEYLEKEISKKKLGELYIKMLTENGITIVHSVSGFKNLENKLNSFGYKVDYSFHLEQYILYVNFNGIIPKISGTISINGTLNKNNKTITLGLDYNPFNNDKVTIE